ncbi:hypothetical protein DLM75_11340 [Leptospira stimsonii]|uniref:Uncharacterized protein n=1 Tax=Leptospira stimsonii TaxID=2202203 RepID=A0A396Z7I4_9LEPT|nr:hypothetical protein DLM75_11340 [Leptospira stimsonii]
MVSIDYRNENQLRADFKFFWFYAQTSSQVGKVFRIKKDPNLNFSRSSYRRSYVFALVKRFIFWYGELP